MICLLLIQYQLNASLILVDADGNYADGAIYADGIYANNAIYADGKTCWDNT